MHHSAANRSRRRPTGRRILPLDRQVEVRCDGFKSMSGPFVGCCLYRIPGAAQWWGVGQVEFADLVDVCAVVDGGGIDVHAFGDFGAAPQVAHELCTKESPGAGIRGDPDADRGGTGVVGLVVIGDGLDC
jgi:hypothetical protein